MLMVSLGLDSRPCGTVPYAFGRFLRLLITAVMLYRRPVWTDRKRRRRELRKFSRRINDFAPDHRQHRFESLDFFVRNRKVISRQYGKVGKLTGSNRALLSFLTREPGASDGIESER